MNFYISDSLENLDFNSNNIEVSDELSRYLYNYSLRNNINDFEILYKIDPYSDVDIYEKDVKKIYEACTYILETSILSGYADYTEGIESIKLLKDMSKEALNRKKILISIGD